MTVSPTARHLARSCDVRGGGRVGGCEGVSELGDHGPCSKCWLSLNMLALITSDCVRMRSQQRVVSCRRTPRPRWSVHSRRRDCHLMAPPCTFSRCFNMDKQWMSVT